MIKKFIPFLAFASMLSLSICNSSCSKDDDDDNAPIVTPTDTTVAPADTTANNNQDPNEEPKDPEETSEDKQEAIEDAKAAAEIIKSVEGKTAVELMMNTSLINEIKSMKEKYENGSDEYQEAFKQEVINNGVSSEVVELLSAEGDIDALALINALGISYF